MAAILGAILTLADPLASAYTAKEKGKVHWGFLAALRQSSLSLRPYFSFKSESAVPTVSSGGL